MRKNTGADDRLRYSIVTADIICKQGTKVKDFGVSRRRWRGLPLWSPTERLDNPIPVQHSSSVTSAAAFSRAREIPGRTGAAAVLESFFRNTSRVAEDAPFQYQVKGCRDDRCQPFRR
jgi:hypothetical protein